MTSLMRQRALAKKLAKLNKEEQVEAISEQEANRLAEEHKALVSARMKSGLEVPALVYQKWSTALMKQLIVTWVENFGEDLALQEIMAEEATAALGKQPAAEESLAPELGMLEGALQGAAGTDESLHQRIAELEAVDTRRKQEFRALNAELLSVNQELLTRKKLLAESEVRACELNERFGMMKKELAAAQRSAISAKCPENGGAVNKELQEELNGAQRELLALKRKVKKLERQGGSPPEDKMLEDMAKLREINAELKKDLQTTNADLMKAWEANDKQSSAANDEAGEAPKLKASLVTSNKELSTAQYQLLGLRNTIKEVKAIVMEMDEYEQDEENEAWIEAILKKIEDGASNE